MLYQSTRCAELTASPAEVVLQGLAPDGGLFVPSSLPRLTPAELEGLDPYALSARVLGALLPELDGMVLAAFSVTVELASRFLDDYLTGDKYFKINYPEHNLVRTRCQIALAKDILRKRDALEQIVRETAQ